MFSFTNKKVKTFANSEVDSMKKILKMFFSQQGTADVLLLNVLDRVVFFLKFEQTVQAKCM